MYMPHWPKNFASWPAAPDLEGVQQLLKDLGSPHLNTPPIIHITGTNGKGSSLSFLKAILEYSGYKVHAYTSPHLYNFNERIVLAGRPISDHFLTSVCEEARVAAKDAKVTFFEGTTAAAFLAFSKIPADFLLLEVGDGRQARCHKCYRSLYHEYYY